MAQTNAPPPLSIDNLPENIGDIAFDPQLDDSTFVLGNPNIVLQYYNTRSYYKDHKKEILTYFKSKYNPPADTSKQNGYLTIRFIINVKGQTGRFRLYELDTNYQPRPFSATISQQLLQLTKTLQGWEPATYKNKAYDSYQYITFKISKGQIAGIAP